MKAIYTHKWSSQFNNEFEIGLCQKEWQTALDGVENNQLAHAFEVCRNTFEWPPSIAEFKRIAMGVVDNDVAFKMALARDFTNPAIESAYKKIGSWDFKHKSEKELRARFNKIYGNECNEILLKTVDKRNRLCDNALKFNKNIEIK